MFKNLVHLVLLFSVIGVSCGVSQPPGITPTPADSPDTVLAPTPAASLTPPPPLEYTIADEASFPAFLPSASLTLNFNQPIDTSQNIPLLFTYPWVDGSTTWDNAFTQLTFTPESGFLPGTVYQVFLNQSLRSQAGAVLEQAAHWQVTTRDAPSLVKRTPGGARLLTRRPQIELTFDRSMDAREVESALKVTPKLDYQVSWKSKSTAALVLNEPLQPGERYRFTLDRSALDEQGVSIGKDLHWDYWLDDWTVDVTGPSVNDPRLPITLKFDYPVDRASLERSLKITPHIKARYSWSTSQVFTITPEAALPRGQSYTISFAGPVVDTSGDALPEIAPLIFNSLPPILAYQPSQEDYVYTDTEIAVEFDRPMKRETVEAAFQIEPAVDGSFNWEENTLVFKPTAPLKMRMSYQITIGTGAVGARGEVLLQEPFSWKFTTGYESLYDITSQQNASFGPYGANAQILDANGGRLLQYVIPSKGQEVTFQLYSLTLAQFLDQYSSGFRGVAGQGDRPLSIAGLNLVATWSADPQAPTGGYQGQISQVTVPANVPPGLYILDLQTGTQSTDRLILVLTANTLVVKQAEDQLVTWVSSINGGGLPFAEIEVYARDGELLASGQADRSGIFRTSVDRDPQPLIVVARSGADLTVSGLGNEWRGSSGYWWGWWQSSPATRHFAAHPYTDRPIYRPGQTVFYKVIARADEDAAISLLPEGTPVTVRVRDARDNVVRTYSLLTNSFGTVDGQFELAEAAMLGEYYLEAVVGGESFYQKFKVQDYRKPDFKVEVSTDRSYYISGDTVYVTVDASYFFGEPVKNAEVVLRHYYLLEMYNYYYSDRQSDEQEYMWSQIYYSDLTGRTDQNGQITFELPVHTDEFGQNEYNGWNSMVRNLVGYEATLDDGTHQTVSGFTAVPVYNADTEVILDAGSYLKKPGQSFPVEATVLTVAGEPVVGSSLLLELRRWTSSSYRYDTIVQSQTFTSGAGGKAHTDFTINEAGSYQLRVTTPDSRGFPVMYSVWIYAYSRGSAYFSTSRDDLRISCDLLSYEPGDTANLVIESRIGGTALLAFERGQVHREQLVQLTPPVTIVPVKVVESDAPNIFVTVNAWKELDTTLTQNTYSSIPDSTLLSASVELIVPVQDKTLLVTLTPDRDSYAPRQDATFTVQVATSTGEPVQAEVSLALVDEAIFSLSPDLSISIYDAFYAQRTNIVRTFNSLALRRELYAFGRGGGGGDNEPGNPRTEFQDTAAWLPSVQIGLDGSAQITFTLPDNLTNWRLTARAVTLDTQVGEAVTNIITHKETIVQPALPRSLTVGDRVGLPAVVHNYAEATRDLAVSLSAGSIDGNLISISSDITQTISLAPGEVRLVSWSVEALQPGTVEVTLTAQEPGAEESRGDAVRLPLIIFPLSVPEVVSYVGDFDDEFYTSLLLPEGALPLSGAELVLSRSIAGSLLDGLEYLTGYPYGCVEQTMSKALPNAVVGRAFNQLGVSNLTVEADLPGQINAGLQRLYGYQHNDGGWGWWYDDLTHDYQTAWVVFGLGMTSQAGYEVDPGVVQRGATWLKNHLTEMDARTQAYALYSMALAGQGDLDTTRQRSRRYFELDVFSQASLALALDALGAADEARQIVSSLAEAAVIEDGPGGQLVYWPQPEEDGHYYAKTMASTTRSTALALSAFVKAAPDHSLLPGIVRWLMAHRRQSGWGTTNETSFAILALTDHLLAIEHDDQDARYVVEMNGVEIASGTFSAGSPGGGGSLEIEIPYQQMVTGPNLLYVRQAGSRQMYYKIVSRSYLPVLDIPAAGWMVLERKFVSPGTRQPLISVKAGDLVQVLLTLYAPQDSFFVVLEDRLPGGLEALNESLNTTSHEEVLFQDPIYFWQQYRYNNKEIRGDRVTFFMTELYAGKLTIQYLARATHSGTFHALPAEAYAMYEPAMWGRSGSSTLKVTP